MACEAEEEQLITGRGGQSFEGWWGHSLSLACETLNMWEEAQGGKERGAG